MKSGSAVAPCACCQAARLPLPGLLLPMLKGSCVCLCRLQAWFMPAAANLAGYFDVSAITLLLVCMHAWRKAWWCHTHLYGEVRQHHSLHTSPGRSNAATPYSCASLGFCIAQVGTWYPLLQQQYTAVTGGTWAPGSNVGIYRNTQRPTTLWWHDHT